MERNSPRGRQGRTPDRPKPAPRASLPRTASFLPGTARTATTSLAPVLTPEGLLAIYRPDIAGALSQSDSPAYRHVQVLEHLMRPGMRSFAEATSLPGEIRPLLDAEGATALEVVGRRAATDGTVKLLLACHDNALVETVVMPYQRRTTACISSQAGCPVGCAFCATGAAGFRRNLTVAEIVDQVRVAATVALENGGRVSNVVYMGMGEPLLNLQAVLTSIRVLTHPRGMNLGHRSLSVSTVGIPAGIVKLGLAEPQVNLAISLHASSDRAREMLVPPRHRHPLSEILAAAWEHFALTRRKLMVEYVLLRGINDSPEDARRLATLLRGHVVTVNLLSWNPVRFDDRQGGADRASRANPREGRRPAFFPSPAAAVAAFRDTLADAKIEVTVRESRGADIEAACGQLAGRQGSYRPTDDPRGHEGRMVLPSTRCPCGQEHPGRTRA
jgi:23S rRNA (adenine2503-C2)-methyltransferase